MARSRVLLCALSVFFGAACDLEVPAGQVTLLANGGSVVAVQTPNGVRVRPGGALVVQDASVFGRGVRVEASDAVPDVLGAAVLSEGGSVRLIQGTLTGGNLLAVADDPATPPNPPSFPMEFPRRRIFPPALMASDSVIEIEGGALVSGGLFDPALTLRDAGIAPGPALIAARSDLTIRAGDFRMGPAAFQVIPAVVLSAQASNVDLLGGTFGGIVNLAGSQSRIAGAELSGLRLGPLAPAIARPGCTEFHDGSLGQVSIASPDETLILFGTSFNHPLGRVPITSVSTPGFIGASPATPSAVVIGALSNGRAFQVNVFASTLDAKVVLAAPGSAGCLAR